MLHKQVPGHLSITGREYSGSEEDDEVTVGVEVLRKGLPSEPAEAGFVERDSHPQGPMLQAVLPKVATGG